MLYQEHVAICEQGSDHTTSMNWKILIMQPMKVITLNTLQLPSFAGKNSLFHDINLNITNIFKTPLVTVCWYKAIYTALMRAQEILVWSCGDAAKTI